MTGGQCFHSLHLRVQPPGDLRGRLRGGVVDVEGMEGEREGLKVLPVRALHLGPALDFNAACRHQQGVLPVVLAP